MVKCACKTLQGLPCKKEAVKMSKYCSVHKSRCVGGKSKPAAKGKGKVTKKPVATKALFTAAEKKKWAKMAAPGYKPKGKIVKHASPEILGASASPKKSPKASPSKQKFLRYRTVQMEGRYNMFDPNARILTGLSEEEYRDV